MSVLKIEELEKRLKNGTVDSLYLFYGEEKYLLENSIKRIKKIFGELINGINYISIDETNVNNIQEKYSVFWKNVFRFSKVYENTSIKESKRSFSQIFISFLENIF